MVDKDFEAWMTENFPSVTDPMIWGIARAAWDGRWEFMVEKFAEQRNERNK